MRVRICLTSAFAAALVLALALAPAPAAAKKKKVKPSTFMGMNLGQGITNSQVWSAQGVAQAAKIGVGNMRVTFFWSSNQPVASMSQVSPDQRQYFKKIKGRPTTFSWTDAVVRAAAKRRISVMPIITSTPPWATGIPGKAYMVPPKKNSDFANYLAALERRYGPKGSFWKENKKIPKRPIRWWQIWNEPAGYCGFGDKAFGWTAPGSALSWYVQLLRASRKTLKKLDPGSKIVASGFHGRSWVALEQLYKGGGGPLFDMAAVHPYDATVDDVIGNIARNRAVMDANGDTSKPMIVSEFGWFSGDGKSFDWPFTTWSYSEQGQAQMLQQAYSRLYALRSQLKLKTLFWFVLVTADQQKYFSFDYSGVFRWRLDDQRYVVKPAAKAYKTVAKYIAKKKVPPSAPSPPKPNWPSHRGLCPGDPLWGT
jgi:hypothetical protein